MRWYPKLITDIKRNLSGAETFFVPWGSDIGRFYYSFIETRPEFEENFSLSFLYLPKFSYSCPPPPQTYLNLYPATRFHTQEGDNVQRVP
jgi:hypothetical protein